MARKLSNLSCNFGRDAFHVSPSVCAEKESEVSRLLADDPVDERIA